MSEPSCAIWYWSHGSVYYSLYESEASAAVGALAINDSGEGSVSGVQFADGSYVAIDEWVEYKAEDERQWQRFSEQLRRSSSLSTRTISAPFDSTERVIVSEEAPSWLGGQ